ncbi:transcriptional regulator [Gordonia paraffinivorans]|uniref:Xre family DNA-binding protein n=2 Tax=Gordonia paraffinivorans TaxID=175628 RepID=A0ABQ0IJA1_9ACTN|nr:helix-turn-helix transcriptional regulator [Gordonia paraffinivorans]MBY4573774.1 transcriptional regulator [Gordonia paraffinivorans]MCD2145396.1 helix-turn-helix domain-containing protein [Gordonia paraffinivorans]PWD43490.1 transcriptional regulator [Gordonia paraffinivorans]VFA89536.1 HTH-type transcriptional regulator sinR [Gordonia paraffinivorans]GAC83662.1 putative Xre family DNA-binding protein [Gordonia paraffinivorans NBRC 108238]
MKREQDEAPLDADVDGGSGSGESGPEASTGDTNAAAGAVEAVEAVANAAQDAVTNAAQDIGAFIRSQRVAAKVSLRQLAERAGVSNPYLSQIERGLRKPSADVLAQIAKGLRVSAEVLYVRAGILEERPASPVRDALIADDSINERQKQMLLEIYESFRKENATESNGHE